MTKATKKLKKPKQPGGYNKGIVLGLGKCQYCTDCGAIGTLCSDCNLLFEGEVTESEESYHYYNKRIEFTSLPYG